MELEQSVMQIRLEDIIPNRFQPRLNFDENALNELADSIRQHGIIQPLVLRRLGDKYEIIAGERRYKAAGLAGLTTVPAVLANIDDNTSAEVALIENLQRKNLSAIEEAKSYKNLLDKDYLTQEQLANKLGVSQSAISNKLRLLNLDQEVQDALMSEKISERHARALLLISDLEEQRKWLQRIIRERMTVRQLDLELKKLRNGGDETNDVPLVNLTPDIEEIKNQAVDIHPEEGPKIMEDIFGNQNTESTEETTTDIDATGGEGARKFFNFLEDEEANLSVEEETTTSNPSFNFNSPADPTTTIINSNESNDSIITPATSFGPAPLSEVTASSSTTPEILTPPVQPTTEQPTEVLDFDFTSQPMPTPESIVNPNPISSQPITSSVNLTPPLVSPSQPEPQGYQIPVNNPITSPSNMDFLAPQQPIIEPTQTFPNVPETGPVVQPEPIAMNPLPEITPIIEQPQIVPPIVQTPQPIFQPITPPLPPTEQFINDPTPEPLITTPLENQNISYVPPKDLNIVDPVNYISSLDPEYEKKMEEAAGLDLNSVIMEIRGKVSDIEGRGFKVDIEEINFDNSYQITIKIEKE